MSFNDREQKILNILYEKPFILETPNEDEGYAKEIAKVKELVGEITCK